MHLIGILSTLLIMCLRTLYGDLYLTIGDVYSISWHCHFLGYLLCLFGAGVYGSCFLHAIFRYWRIIFSNRTLLQNLSFHLLLILTHWFLIIILLLPILSRSIYISADHFCLNPFDNRYTATYIAVISIVIPVSGISILYIKIVIYMRNHIQSRKERKRTRKDMFTIRRIFFLVLIIFQTSSTGIILWICTFFQENLHRLFYRLLRMLLILCMIICSITLLILSPQLRRILRANHRQTRKRSPIPFNSIDEAKPSKSISNSQI